MGEKFSRKLKGQLSGRKTSVSNRTGGDAARKQQMRRHAKRQTTKAHGTKKVLPGTGQR